MADKPIVLSDVLCFIVNKFVNNDVNMMKAALSDNMPSLRLYQGDIDVIVRLLHNMEHKVEEFGVVLAAITRDVRARHTDQAT